MRLMKRAPRQRRRLEESCALTSEVYFHFVKFHWPGNFNTRFVLISARMPRATWCRWSSGQNHEGTAFGTFSVYQPDGEVHDE